MSGWAAPRQITEPRAAETIGSPPSSAPFLDRLAPLTDRESRADPGGSAPGESGVKQGVAASP